MDVLVSGAGIAGLVLAHWLERAGARTTVVELTPRVRQGTGGHAVDLFAPGMQVAERMGIAESLRAATTSSTGVRLERPGKPPIAIRHDLLHSDAGTERHVEVIRGDLIRILHEATPDGVEQLFGDSIAALSEDADGVDVRFESGRDRRFDLVIGADGLHSTVRRLAFGPEQDFSRPLGAHLAVFTVPNRRGLTDETLLRVAVGQMVAMYRVPGTDEARVVMLFRTDGDLGLDRRDVDGQKRALRDQLNRSGWEVPDLLSGLDAADDVYLDSISQVVMDSWSRGRVTLVGDAGFSPGPAVGGGTTLAAVSAYTLARSLSDSDGDHRAAFSAYEERIRDYVEACRGVGPRVLRSGIPHSRAQVAAYVWGMRMLPYLPAALRRRLVAGGAVEALSDHVLPD